MSDFIYEDARHLGFDETRLARIKPFFDNYIEQNKLSGYGILIARGGKIAHQIFSGHAAFADMNDGSENFTPDMDSLFRIYSMTKPITSIALMQLYEQAKFQLYDPVHKFIPTFKNLEVFESGTAQNYTTRKPARDITIHDLLTHQSGLTYDFMFTHTVDAIYRNHRINGARSEKYNLIDFVDKVAEMPLLCDPGAGWNYSVSTDICGRLIEIISGQSLDDYFAEHIFTPLGMDDTSFTISEDKKNRLTHNYSRDPLSRKITLADSPTKTIYKEGREFLSGGGGLLSTMDNYYRFTEMLRQNGRVNDTSIIMPKTLKLMTSNHLPRNETLMEHASGAFSEVSYGGTGFGLGFSVIVNEAATTTVSSRGLYSWGGLASTFFWVDPTEDLVVIFMTQLMPSASYPVRPQLFQLVYGSLL